MNPAEFIVFAKSLSDSGTSGAAGYRSSVSRAYYGAYLNALAWIEGQVGVQCKHGTWSSHRVVQMFLANCQVPEAVEIGKSLSILHEKRKDADYEMTETDPEGQAESQDCVASAEAIVSKIGKCNVLATRQKIKAGIIQFKKTSPA